MMATRTSRSARRPLRTRAWIGGALVLMGLSACQRTTDGGRLGPSEARASLGVAAAIQASTATDVEVRVSYARSNGTTQEIVRRTVPLTADATQSVPVGIDLAGCFGDPLRAAQGDACPVIVELTLLRGTTPLDRQTVPASIRPGDAVVIDRRSDGQPLALYEVSRIQIAAPAPGGGTTTTPPRVEVGEAVTLSAAALDANGGAIAGRTYQWTSTRTTVLRVDAATGVVTGVAPGTDTVRVASGGRTAQIVVTIVPAAVRTIAVTPTTLALDVGSTGTITATPRDARNATLTGRTLTWTTSNANVAAVSPQGVVTGRGGGTATVTVSSAEGPNGTTVSTNVPVTVTSRLRAGVLAGRLYDATSNAGLAGATVIIQDTSLVSPRIVAQVTTGSDGSWRTASLPGGEYRVIVSSQQYVPIVVADALIDGDVTLPATPAVVASTQNGSISGTLLDATTNRPLAVPATLFVSRAIFTQSRNFGTRDVLPDVLAARVSVPAGGVYAPITLPAGTYQIRVSATGYADATRIVAVLPGRTTTAQNVFVSPTGAVDLVRVVLTWGATPQDLDAHLTGPRATAGTRFLIGYEFNTFGNCGADPFACLDVDETAGFGPETMTITKQLAGTYRYAVHNFSGEAPISVSGAQVAVYIGNTLVRTFSPPTGSGDWWNVFELANGQITPINSYSTTAPADPAAGTGAGMLRPAKLPTKTSAKEARP